MSTRNLTGKSEPDPCIMCAGLAQSTKPKYSFFLQCRTWSFSYLYKVIEKGEPSCLT